METNGKRNPVYGGHRCRLYRAWQNMRARCKYPSKSSYKYYGGRGITVCNEWEHSYSAFAEWALSHGYADNLTLDRIDCDGAYSPDNCRWVTTTEQNRNLRNNRKVTYCGETKTIGEWAREYGLPNSTLYSRIMRGWALEKAFAAPAKP